MPIGLALLFASKAEAALIAWVVGIAAFVYLSVIMRGTGLFGRHLGDDLCMVHIRSNRE